MIVESKIEEVRKIIEKWHAQGASIGFVPTMGYLHDGHKSLIEAARKENDRVVVSIFVNPIQFGIGEDFEKYPRDMERDKAVCRDAGADLIFAPDEKEMYPFGPPLSYVDIDELGEGLCGARRKGHFRGVCTVVSKLFHIISPDRAYFGEKDAQQLAIIKRMALDLNFKTQIVPCPIIREPDGLAMSSRNSYLTPAQREAALVISRALELSKKALKSGERETGKIKTIIDREISKEPLARLDYAEVVDLFTLKTKEQICPPVLVMVAAYVGKTRLIDNFTFAED